jgi:hypothetical protein
LEAKRLAIVELKSGWGKSTQASRIQINGTEIRKSGRSLADDPKTPIWIKAVLAFLRISQAARNRENEERECRVSGEPDSISSIA